MIPLYKPFINKNVINFARDALDSTWISSKGKYLDLTKEKLSQILNVENLLLVNNGTSATKLIFKALKYEKSNIKNIIVPNNVYVAAWNSVLSEYPKEVMEAYDASIRTWNIDFDYINFKELDAANSAILIVHNLGNIINVPNILDKYPNISIVEDNCEGLFGKYRGQYSGTSSIASSISFFGNKTITSGEGGAVIIKNKDTYEFLKKFSNHGQSDVRYIHDIFGDNYRMTNVQAAILYGQLNNLNEILDKKNIIFEKFRKELNSENILLQEVENETTHSNWMMGIRIPGLSSYKHAENYFIENNIETRPMFYPVTHHKHLKDVKLTNGINNAELLNNECIIIPSFPELKKKEIEHIIKHIILFSKNINEVKND